MCPAAFPEMPDIERLVRWFLPVTMKPVLGCDHVRAKDGFHDRAVALAQ
jgi:hypothetical protein